MKTIILSAGQGRRLLPLTADTPKCLLQVGERSVLEWQLHELQSSGIDQVVVIVGYGADKVEDHLKQRGHDDWVRTVYNPFYAVADNLGSCWVARHEMLDDFVLLNGDTLFESAIPRRLLSSPVQPVTLVTDSKPTYDADDMKVILDGTRLAKVGKTIPIHETHGESIGMMAFRDEGPSLFRQAVERALRRPESLKKWYLSIVDELAQQGQVWTCAINGLGWGEIDSPADLDYAHTLAERFPSR
ncbi:MAG: phosphocholine cytidylyltransferase family protein [Nitrospirales bacterium]|nr:phosphocholine cytidylyltransferase family protein [Nitrospira sp.]MDR4503154.1 phosphocholine cytidylyltransferase family protein [Nitrospirales bacterium]